MDLRERLSLPKWDALTDDEAREAVTEVERLVPRARFVGFDTFTQANERHRVARFEVDEHAMVLVPGGRVSLGFEPEQLDDSAVAAWSRSFREHGHAAQQLVGGPDVERPPPDEMLTYLRNMLSPLREVAIDPFLFEQTSPAVDLDDDRAPRGEGDPHVAMAEALVAAGFRLASEDEWEHACSGGARTLFRWGNQWPLDTDVWDGGPFEEHRRPNAFGLRFGANPYHSEIVVDNEVLLGGDGGCLVCGEAGPICWLTFAPAFRQRLKVTDDREIWFEQAHPRKALSIFPRDGENVVRPYVAPTALENVELAVSQLRSALSSYDTVVTTSKAQQKEIAGRLPQLDAILAAHPDVELVQVYGVHALRLLGRLDEAERLASRILEVARTFNTLKAMALVKRARGEIDATIVLLDQAAALDETDSVTPVEAAERLLERKRFAEAAERYELAHRRDENAGYARVMALYAQFRATKNRKWADELVAIARGEAKGVEWIEKRADEIAPGWRAKAKAHAKKKAKAAKPPVKKKAKAAKPPVKKKAKAKAKAPAKKKAKAKPPVAKKNAKAPAKRAAKPAKKKASKRR